MVTKPTGNPPGHPRVALHDHPLRFDLALAEAIRRGLKVSRNRARALAVLELRARKTDDAEPRLALFQRVDRLNSFAKIDPFVGVAGQLGNIRRGSISANDFEINTLEQDGEAGTVEADPEYFEKLATCFFAALFSKAGLEMRATGIELLSREIGEQAHFAAMVAKLREDNWRAMLHGLAARLQ